MVRWAIHSVATARCRSRFCSICSSVGSRSCSSRAASTGQHHGSLPRSATDVAPWAGTSPRLPSAYHQIDHETSLTFLAPRRKDTASRGFGTAARVRAGGRDCSATQSEEQRPTIRKLGAQSSGTGSSRHRSASGVCDQAVSGAVVELALGVGVATAWPAGWRGADRHTGWPGFRSLSRGAITGPGCHSDRSEPLGTSRRSPGWDRSVPQRDRLPVPVASRGGQECGFGGAGFYRY